MYVWYHLCVMSHLLKKFSLDLCSHMYYGTARLKLDARTHCTHEQKRTFHWRTTRNTHFIDLHANRNCSLVIHECTVHSHVSLDNDIRPQAPVTTR